MKTISGYLILFISFFGLIYLKHFFSFSKNQDSSEKFPAGKRYFTAQMKIDSKMRNRIAKLEKVVDSLIVKNEGFFSYTDTNLSYKIPTPEPTPIAKAVNYNKIEVKKDLFLSLNDAAKIRDSRTKLSLIAQEYINLAYEMGGDNWYGAEEVWGTDAFKNRVNKLHEEDG